MNYKIKTSFNSQIIFHKKVLLDTLRNEGLTISNEDPIEFKEYYNFTTHTGKNRWKILRPLLKGKLFVDNVNEVLIWEVNIGGMLFGSILLLILTTIIFGFYYELSFINAALIWIGFSGLLLSIIWFVLRSRIDGITYKLK